MKETEKDLEIKSLKKDVAKLRLEANMRKSLSNQLTAQKKVADELKAEALAKSEELKLISEQLSKYLSPQIHEQIFSGRQTGGVKSNRKKLTIFFSDIVNFTEISDELESEELTNLLNFYLNEMSQIALSAGGTIDKYIGDAILIFFGDPESSGVENDARKCVEMAIRMQTRMTDLSTYWGKHFGLKKNLQIRIGINTGFCTVGNFGSEDRLDYTVMGGAVNLASRLEGLAKPGAINISEETQMLVKPFFSLTSAKEVEVKGFLRKIKYFQVDVSDTPKELRTIIAGNGFDLSIDNSLLRENDLYELHEKLKEISKGFKRQNN